MTATKNKIEYIEAWDSHIDDFNILAFCRNKEHSEKVRNLQKQLRKVMREIAETKDLN